MPTNTVSSKVLTLLFTDLEGSTSLKSEKGDWAAAELMSLHREHVNRLARETNGTIYDWAGDGCYLAFDTPSTAVLFSLQLQQFHHEQPDLPKVRIGIHMGEVTERQGLEGELPKPEGLAVDITGRVRDMALPGQVLMSAAVLNSARQQIGGEVSDRQISWSNYGEYPLKGINDPIQVGEVVLEGVSPLTPPKVSQEAERPEVPAAPTAEVTRPKDDNSVSGLKYILRFTPEDLGKAASALTKAVEIDNANTWAHGALAYVYWEAANQGWLQHLGVSFFQARLLARQYLGNTQKGRTSFAHLVESEIQLYRRQHAAAVSEAERAMASDPDNPVCSAGAAHALVMADRCGEAVDICEQALRADPPKPGRFLYCLGLAHFAMGQLEKAIEMLDGAIIHDPKTHLYAAPLAASCAYLGNDKRARSALAHYRRIRVIQPNLRDAMYFWPFADTEISDRFAEGLRKAKLPGQRSGYYKVSEMRRLTGNEIKDLLFGKTVSGFYPWMGQQEWIDRDWSGRATMLGGRDGKTRVDESNGMIEGDNLIDQWQERWKGISMSSPVYENPAGSAETKDEYILFTDFGFWPISPA